MLWTDAMVAGAGKAFGGLLSIVSMDTVQPPLVDLFASWVLVLKACALAAAASPSRSGLLANA